MVALSPSRGILNPQQVLLGEAKSSPTIPVEGSKFLMMGSRQPSVVCIRVSYEDIFHFFCFNKIVYNGQTDALRSSSNKYFIVIV